MLDMDYLYFLVGIVKAEEYTNLCDVLGSIEYTWIHPLDENRAIDGLRLREDYEGVESYSSITRADGMPCSVLEMLVALALRCERDIMYNVDFGDRTYIWFHDFIKNLGFESYKDEYFHNDGGRLSERILNDIHKKIGIWLRREYEFDGRGGICPLFVPFSDQKRGQTWLQLNLYLAENYPK